MCVTKLRVCDKEECDKVVSVTKLCVCDQEECDKEECDKLVCVKDCVCVKDLCVRVTKLCVIKRSATNLGVKDSNLCV